MLDIGWSELMVIGVVALIVVGPKDLPGMFQTLGRFTAKMRGMARDFQRSMEEAAKESGVNDIAGDLKGATSPKEMGLDALEKIMDDATAGMKKWTPGSRTEALSEERAAAAEKIKTYAAQKAQSRIDAEALAQSGTPTPDDAVTVVTDDAPAPPAEDTSKNSTPEQTS